MTTLPTLYKRNSNGSVNQWTVSVDGNVISTTYGQVGGAMQTTRTMATCAVKLAGDTSVLAQAWQQPDKWIGKMLTVKYQGRTAAGVLRFPVGLRLREEV